MTTPATPDESLKKAHAAFEAGNYALVRDQALPLAKSDNPTIRAEAQKLLNQISPAPVGKYLFLLTALLLLSVTYFAYSQ